jgi:hypothetical protein
MELGPSGFPFEKYVAEILKYQGYRVEVGVIVEGFCVKHEVDIIAEKEAKHFMIECKFHNQPGTFCDVKIPLYINSRFLDIEKMWKEWTIWIARGRSQLFFCCERAGAGTMRFRSSDRPWRGPEASGHCLVYPKNFPSHRILRHMHRALLNIDKNKN